MKLVKMYINNQGLAYHYFSQSILELRRASRPVLHTVNLDFYLNVIREITSIKRRYSILMPLGDARTATPVGAHLFRWVLILTGSECWTIFHLMSLRWRLRVFTTYSTSSLKMSMNCGSRRARMLRHTTSLHKNRNDT